MQAPFRVTGAGLHNCSKAFGFAQSVAALQQPQHSRSAQRSAAVDIAVLTRHHLGQLGAGKGYTQALPDLAQELHTAPFMTDMARQQGRRRQSLPQVVHQASPPHFKRCRDKSGLLQHHHQVHARINFRMVFNALRHAPQGVHFRQQHPQGTAGAQNVQHARGMRLHQTGGQFSPHALWHQSGGFPCADHLMHQHGRGRRCVEVCEPGCKARQTQDTHRVFAKGIGAMAKGPGPQVSHAAERIDNACGIKTAIGVDVCGSNCHRVDGQVATAEVLLQGNGRVGLHHETPVTGPRLALGAGKRIFLACDGMQKNREVTAYGLVPGVQHGLGAAAHDDPVAVLHGQAHQGIAHCATDQVGLHGQIMGPARAAPQA